MITLFSGHRFVLLSHKLLTMLSFGLFIGSTWAHGNDESKEPFEAFVNSLSWASVFSRDHDVTATVTGGANEESPVVNNSIEVVCKSRQIFDSQSREFWIPYACGSFDVQFNDADVSPRDRRSIGILFGKSDWAKEKSFNGGSTRDIRNSKDILKSANPIDLVNVAINPCSYSLQSIRSDVRNFDIVLERLESLNSNQLHVAEEKLDNRPVKVYRVKAVPLAKSVAIATNKIVVSMEGHDKGLVLEFYSDSMKLGDKKRYVKDSQLIGSTTRKHRIYWKEFETTDSNNEKKQIVLPVSISKKSKRLHSANYMNVSFEWNSFATPAKELRSIEAGEKIAREFDREANKKLNR